tara:strand:- start:1375 stop:1986 length:612 start_codon:yes stop_codon:yes gene_type:complete
MNTNQRNELNDRQVKHLIELKRRKKEGLFQIDETCASLEYVIIEDPVPNEYSIDWLIPILDTIFITIAQSISEDELTSDQISHINAIFELADKLCTRISTPETVEKAKEWIAIQRIVVELLGKNTSIEIWLKERNPYIRLIERISSHRVPFTTLLEEYKSSKEALLQILAELKNVGLIKQCLLEDNTIALQLTERALKQPLIF